jgi:hypothetical protein
LPTGYFCYVELVVIQNCCCSTSSVNPGHAAGSSGRVQNVALAVGSMGITGTVHSLGKVFKISQSCRVFNALTV